MSDSQPKNYPVVTPEIAKMFGLSSDSYAAPHADPSNAVPDAHADLSQVLGAEVTNTGHVVLAESVHAEHAVSAVSDHDPVPTSNTTMKNMGKALKSITPYIVVFSVALFMYFFFFSSSGFNFDFIKGWTGSVTRTVETPKQNLLTDLQKENLDAYNKWILGFYYDVSDSKVLDPNGDNSSNGLSNFQKFLLNLNPKSYDTLGLGAADSETLDKGTNPLSGGKLTESQKSIIDKYFDMEVVMNRLALAQLEKNGSVAGAVIVNASSTQVQSNSGYSSFPISQGGSQSATSQDNQGQAVLDSTSQSTQQPVSGMPMADGVEIDANIPGRLEINSLKINAPLMWSSDPKNFDRDLQSGVIHYPGTALPGQIGTTYISGHSSNYAWAKGNYNNVFTHLNDLADNTSFKITVVQKNGKDAVLHYVVVGRQEYKPTDQAQFRNTGDSLVALSTCWPIGSTAKRLVVYGKLTQVVKN